MSHLKKSNIDLMGMIDMHIHSSPDATPRWADDLTMARLAHDAGMRAIVIKSHHTITADRARIAETVISGMRVFGGLALNSAVGGFNPYAVEAAAQMGAVEIWMPTRSAAHIIGKTGFSVLNDYGELRKEIKPILEIIRDQGMILATGHISPIETVCLIKKAKEMGVAKMIITHPEADFIRLPLEAQLELRGPGVYFERCYVDTTPVMDSLVSIETIAKHIRAVGIEFTILATDYGRPECGSPVEGYRDFLHDLLLQGFKWSDLLRMGAKNPAEILGLDE